MFCLYKSSKLNLNFHWIESRLPFKIFSTLRKNLTKVLKTNMKYILENHCEIRIKIEINSKRETLWPRSAIKTHFLPDLLHGLHTKRRLRTRTYFIHSIFCENVFSYFGGDCHSWCCQHEMWSSRCHLSPCKISHHKEEQKGKSEVEQLTG